MRGRSLGAWLGLMLLAGCASSPATRFYVLESEAGRGAGRDASPGAATCRIGIGAITVPGAVDRPQLVVRSGANRVEVLEQERWAEPLREALPRVLGEALRRELPRGALLRARGASGEAPPELTVTLDFDRFELTRGSAALSLRATLSPARGKPPGEITIRVEEASQQAGYPGVVAAASRALDHAAAELAPALTSACGAPGAGAE